MKKLINIKHYPSNFKITFEENEESATHSLSYDGLKGELSREEWQEDDFISSFNKEDQEEILNYMSLFYIFNN